ncbi:MAG TPA: GDP-mannose 4,6-dehydratase [Acidimicrobiia bacterium]|nr:GDP-mannose 4,6-dehydratase [Acidimicrobiia bacterium]
MPKALITGITGQDGSYLTELLLDKGYEVHGLIRRTSTFHTDRLDHLYQDPHEKGVQLHLHYGDLTDGSQLARLIRTVKPHEIYNLAAQSHVAVSFEQPEYTGDVDALGVLRLLEAVRDSDLDCAVYQAGTSEMFGTSPPPQSEATEFRPASPYAAAKLYAYWLVRNYREAYDLKAVTGILFNHESPRRGETFVTRKITRAVSRILAGLDNAVYLGNLDAERDWGHAKEYVEAMYLMMQQPNPRDFVIGTGEAHTVRELCNVAFQHVGLEPDRFIKIDPRYYRPVEVERLRADASQAKDELGWSPTIGFEDLVHEMVEYDLEQLGMNLDQARDIATRL